MVNPHHPEGDENRFIRKDGELLYAVEIIRPSHICTHCDLHSAHSTGCSYAKCGSSARKDKTYVAFMTLAHATEARLLGVGVMR